MLKNKPGVSIDNSGENQGVMADQIIGQVDNSKTYNIILTDREKQNKLPSLIPQIVEALAELTVLPEQEIDRIYKVKIEDLKSYDIPKKITHNNLILYKDVIKEYSQYGRICEEAFNIVDNSMIGAKGKILRDMRHLYRKFKGELIRANRDTCLEEMDIVRQNADLIIDMIKDELEVRILEDCNSNIFKEDLEDGLIRILCYSFVECKILEKPR